MQPSSRSVSTGHLQGLTLPTLHYSSEQTDNRTLPVSLQTAAGCWWFPGSSSLLMLSSYLTCPLVSVIHRLEFQASPSVAQSSVWGLITFPDWRRRKVKVERYEGCFHVGFSFTKCVCYRELKTDKSRKQCLAFLCLLCFVVTALFF